jgi:hypothetical protein
VPADLLSATTISAGGSSTLALLNDRSPTITVQPWSRSAASGTNLTLRVLAVGQAPLRYQWYCNGRTLPGATSNWLAFTGTLPSQSGAYQLVAMNSFGAATSAVATITVSLPAPILLSTGMVTNGFRFTFASIAGVIYVVEFKDNLMASEWMELERRFGLGGLEIVTDTSANGTMRFYRVRALYAPSPKLAAATWSGGSVNFSFATVAGAQYVVEYTDQLAPPQWHELQTVVGTGSSVGFADPTPAGPQRFYRLRVR